MKRIIVGDIHSCYDKLISVLEKAGFNENDDELYSVGDLLDRGEQPVETLDFLMGLKNFYPVLGNHDIYFEEYLCTGRPDSFWLSHNGGMRTFEKVMRMPKEWKEKVKAFYRKIPVLRVLKDSIIMHGGPYSDFTEKELDLIASRPRPFPFINDDMYSEEDDVSYLEDFMWDRDYLYSAMYDAGVSDAYNKIRNELLPIETKKTIWVGHTPLPEIGPFYSKKFHLAAIDTGSFFYKITAVDMDTMAFYQA